MLTLDSRELMARAQAGDADAFAALYTECRAYVHTIAHQSHPASADDITQEVFIRAYRSLHLWHDQGKDPIAWLTIITRNICRDRARSPYARFVDLGAHVPERATASGTAPIDTRRDLLAALRRVDAEQRRALVLHYLNDMPVDQVAAEMGRTRGSVCRLLYDGRRAMARRLIDERTPA